jgi:hypothetical protein
MGEYKNKECKKKHNVEPRKTALYLVYRSWVRRAHSRSDLLSGELDEGEAKKVDTLLL